jgi:hypothetical protein
MLFLLELHPAVSIIILCSITLSLSYTGLRIVRKRFPHEILKENHEVGGFIFNAFGLVYAVLVAFVVYATWNEYIDADRNTGLEASELSDLLLNSLAFGEPMKSEIKIAVKNYSLAVVNDEWRMLSHGEMSSKATGEFHNLWGIYTSADVSLLKNEPAYRESLRHLNDLSEYRRIRLFQSNDDIPWVIWLVLWFGAVVSVIYTFFFGTKKMLPQFLMTAALTITNTMVLYLIYILDNPFRGSIKIQPIAFEYLIRVLQ